MFLNESSKITAHLTTSLWGPPAQQPLFPRARCRSPDRALLPGTFRDREPRPPSLLALLPPGAVAPREGGADAARSLAGVPVPQAQCPWSCRQLQPPRHPSARPSPTSHTQKNKEQAVPERYRTFHCETPGGRGGLSSPSAAQHHPAWGHGRQTLRIPPALPAGTLSPQHCYQLPEQTNAFLTLF